MNNLNAKVWIFPAMANALTHKFFFPQQTKAPSHCGWRFFMDNSIHVYASLTMNDQTDVNLLLDPSKGWFFGDFYGPQSLN